MTRSLLRFIILYLYYLFFCLYLFFSSLLFQTSFSLLLLAISTLLFITNSTWNNLYNCENIFIRLYIGIWRLIKVALTFFFFFCYAGKVEIEVVHMVGWVRKKETKGEEIKIYDLFWHWLISILIVLGFFPENNKNNNRAP